jgi:hypothetical protein
LWVVSLCLLKGSDDFKAGTAGVVSLLPLDDQEVWLLRRVKIEEMAKQVQEALATGVVELERGDCMLQWQCDAFPKLDASPDDKLDAREIKTMDAADLQIGDFAWWKNGRLRCFEERHGCLLRWTMSSW